MLSKDERKAEIIANYSKSELAEMLIEERAGRRKVVQAVLDADIDPATASNLLAKMLIEDDVHGHETVDELSDKISRILKSRFSPTSQYTADFIIKARGWVDAQEYLADEIFQIVEALAPEMSPNDPMAVWPMVDKFLTDQGGGGGVDAFMADFDNNIALIKLMNF